jgi:hypothetical protein
VLASILVVRRIERDERADVLLRFIGRDAPEAIAADDGAVRFEAGPAVVDEVFVAGGVVACDVLGEVLLPGLLPSGFCGDFGFPLVGVSGALVAGVDLRRGALEDVE